MTIPLNLVYTPRNVIERAVRERVRGTGIERRAAAAR